MSHLTFKSIHELSSYSIIKELQLTENYNFILNIKYPKNINFHCDFEKLDSITIIINENINLEDSFPFFSEKCQDNFNYLNSFKSIFKN